MASITRGHTNRIILVGMFASVALPAALAATGRASGVECLLTGLMVGTATLVLDAGVRAERRFRLRQLLESAEWLPGGVLSLSGAARRIVEDHAEPEIVAEARHRLARVVEDFEHLAEGRIHRPAGDCHLLIAGTAACHRRLEAVTDISSGPGGLRWWDSDIGRRYWQANLDALGRGVGITRVFVCARMDADLAALIAEQSQAGVRTLVALREGGAGRAARAPANLAVWDGRRGWEARTDPHDGADGTVFTVNERDLQRLTSAFATWSAGARVVDG